MSPHQFGSHSGRSHAKLTDEKTRIPLQCPQKATHALRLLDENLREDRRGDDDPCFLLIEPE